MPFDTAYTIGRNAVSLGKQAIGAVVSGLDSSGREIVEGLLGSEGRAPGDDLGQSQYDFKYLVFPNDIGMDYMGHYMVININVPTKGFTVGSSGLALFPPAGAYTSKFTALDQVSKVDVLRFGTYESIGYKAPPGAVPRRTRRIAESIALFMPNGLSWSQGNQYEDVSWTEAVGKIGIGGLVNNRFVDGFRGINDLMGNPINPSVEVIFNTTLLREFTFEFLCAPRNEQESINLKSIIRTLKFHGVPEINNGIGSMFTGGTWIPPAEFDITFFDKGVENQNILRINTCVLTRIDVDYEAAQGTGFTAFRNGHPTAVALRLTFLEVEPISKIRSLQGF